MNQTPNRTDPPVAPDPAGTPPPKRSNALLWLLLLLVLVLLGWWWFSQRGTTSSDSTPLPTAPGSETATATAEAERAAAAEQEKKKAAEKAAASKPKPKPEPRVTEPRPLADQNAQPEYPREAQRRGVSGRVLLRVDVGADGAATNVDFVQRSGSPELDRAAMNAVRKWRFAPARRDGKPVASSVQVPIDFVLPKG